MDPTPSRSRGSSWGDVPEEWCVFTDLTVLENLEVGTQAPHPAALSCDSEKLMRLFSSLRELQYRRGGQMGGGGRPMLTVARTLMGNPRLVMLDEPAARPPA